jgi:pentatricopeptide repeat protein
MREAELVEQVLSKSLQEARTSYYTNKRSSDSTPLLFPSVRQCNAAIATFGDSGDFRRALKVFTDMRKSVSIMRRMFRSSSLLSQVDSNDHTSLSSDKESQMPKKGTLHSPDLDLVEAPPAPTLVTYSTLISRAVTVRKPRVAVRLWNLMKNQPTYYTNVISRKQRQGRISDPSVFLDPAELRKLELEDDAIVPDVIFWYVLHHNILHVKCNLEMLFVLYIYVLLNSSTYNTAIHS